MAAPRLSKLDWIKAGFRALTLEGLNAVRVEPLARALKVSKGSFYWHFSDLAALRQAMLQHWEQAATTDIIASIEAIGGPAADRLSTLMEVAVSDRDAPYGGAMAEVALRAWAAHDPDVAAVQARVDAARLGYLERLLSESGKSKAAAQSWARLLLFCYVGAAQAPPEMRITAVQDLLTACRASPG